MTILITGAAGFIGSFLARALINQGEKVIGIDNFNDYYPRKCKEFNVDLLRLQSKQEPTTIPKEKLLPILNKLQSYPDSLVSTPGTFHFYEADITNLNQLTKIFQQHNITSIIHLAAMAGVPKSTKQPLLYTKVNIEGTMNLLTLANTNKIQKFLFASSSSVYGHRETQKVKETDDITKARSVYGATKAAGEILCHSFHSTFNLNVAIVRIFGPIYGPLQRPYGMLHQRAINYIFNNKTLQIYGYKGLETAKDSTYIDDEVQGFLKILNSAFKYEIYNIGTSNPLPIKHWLDCIEQAAEKKLNINIIEADKADVSSSADITKAKENLGYEPKTTMQEGVKRQVEIFKLMPNWYQTMDNV